MTAQETLLRRRTALFALSALLMGSACGGDKKHNPHADKDAGMVDAGDGDGDTNNQPDAGNDGGVDSGPVGPETCGPTDKICGGATPACVNGECVECSSSETSQCAANEGCDPTTHTCVRNAPFALDCADLPTDGACHGGPREVLLVQDAAGLILMFDPQDGHYLGVFKRALNYYEGNYHQAVQGPDQCIWTAQDGDRGIERWDTDGTFKDQIVAPAKYYEGQDDIVQEAHGIAFTKDYAYVAFHQGDPHGRLVRFKLDGLSADAAGTYDVVLDDGTVFDSVIVLGDESLVLTNDESVVTIPAGGGKANPLLTGLMSFYSEAQVSYAGGGEILTASYEGSMYKVELASGKTQEVVPFMGTELDIQGVAALGNGKWLYADRNGKLEALDPASKNPTGQHKSLFSDPTLGVRTFGYVGRACLSNEFVAAASAVDAPAASCDQPAGEVVVSQDFETDTFTGSGDQKNLNGFYEVPATGVTVSVDATQGVEASGHSLKIAGGTNVGGVEPTYSGVHYALPAGTKPSYIGYYVRVDRETSAAGYFSLNQWPASLDAVYLEDKSVQTFNTSGKTTIANNTWVQIQLRDFDWTHMTYDLYVNCTRVMDDISFAPGSANGADEIDLFNLPSNYENTPEATSWYDKIVILK